MPSLLNKQTGQAERVLDEQVPGMLQSGQYQLLPDYVRDDGKRIRVISPDGEYGSVPAAKFQTYLKNGFRLANDADKFATGGGGTLGAIGLGALAGPTLGLSNYLIASLGGADTVDALRKAHPTATAASEITTAVASALLGNVAGPEGAELSAGTSLVKASEAAQAAGAVEGGAGLLGNTIKALGKAARYTPTGYVSGATSSVMDPLAKGLIAELTGGTKLGLITASVMRGASLMPGAAAEGALWGMGQALTEHALGDPREVGEMMTDIVWPTMGWGAATAGVLGTAGALVGGGVSKMAKRVTDKLSSPEADAMMLSQAEQGVASHFGWSNAQTSRVRRAAGEGFDVLFDDGLLHDGSVFSKRVATEAGETAVTVTAKEAGQRAELALGTAGATLDSAWKRAAEFAESSMPISKVEEMQTEFKNAMKAARAAGPKTDAGHMYINQAREIDAALSRTAEEGPWPSLKHINKVIQDIVDQPGMNRSPVRAMRKEFETFIKENGSRVVMDFEELRNLRKQYGTAWAGIYKGGKPSHIDVSKGEAWRTIERVLQDEAMSKAGKTLTEPEYAVLEKANKTYAALRPAVDAIKSAGKAKPGDMGLGQLFQRWGYMGQWAMRAAASKVARGAVGSAVGGLVGGIPGMALGGMAGVGVGKMMPRAIVIAEVAHRAARLGTLAEKTAAYDAKIQGAIGRWLKWTPGVKAIPPIVGAGVLKDIGRDTDPRKGLKNLRKRVSMLQDPAQLGQYLEESLGALRSIAPTTALHSAATLSRGIQELNRIMEPEQQARQPSLQPHLKIEPDVSNARLEEIGLRVAAVMKPMDTVEEILNGTATQPQMETFVRTYPELWTYVMRNVAMQLAQRKEPLNHGQKLVLARLGFQDWETPSWLGPAAQQLWQQQGQAQSPNGAAPQPAPGAFVRPPSARAFTGLARLDQAFQTPQGRRQAEGV